MSADNLIHENLPGSFARLDRAEKSDDRLSKLISVGALLTLVFTALAFGAVESWSIAVFGFLVLILSLLWVAKAVSEKQMRIRIPATVWPIVALWVWGLLQTVSKQDETGKRFAVSLDVEATRLALEVLGILLAAFLIFANFFASGKRLLWFRSFLVLFGLAMAVFGLVQKFSWNGKYFWLIQPSTLPTSPFGSFVNHNHFAGYLEMIAPIGLAMIMVRSVYREIMIFYGFALVMMSVAVFLSLSRGGMISLMAGLIFVVVFGAKSALERFRGEELQSRKPVILLQTLAVLLVVVAIAFGVIWTGGDEVLDRAREVEVKSELRGVDDSQQGFFESREWIWRDTMAMIRANWQMGVGLGAYETAYPLFTKSNGSVIVSQAHNDYLQVVADCGVIGGVLAVWFLIVLFRDLRRAMSHHEKVMSGMALGCGGGLVALLVHSLFDFNLQLPSNALLFLALVAVISNIRLAAEKMRQARVG